MSRELIIMEKSELEEKLKKLEQDHELIKKSVIRDYCNSNNSYKIGDKFTDHIGSILIEKINYQYWDRPCCVYYGLDLKKDGTPTKKLSKRNAWQSNELKN